jgi:hypothetical protein
MDAVVAALASVGLSAQIANQNPDSEVDLVIDIRGVFLGVELKTASTVTPDWLRRWPAEPAGEGRVFLLVADRILSAARDLLRERGWGWLDLRGHLRLSGPGVLVDVDVPARAPARESVAPFSGAVGLELTCALLLEPGRQASVRGLAREIGRSASAVSVALDALRRDQLITKQGTPAIPELFWAAVSAWKPVSNEVARLSSIDDPAIAGVLRTGWADPISKVGWVLTDSLAAASYGAPVGVSAHYPPDFYVPDIVTARRAETLLGVPLNSEARGATLRVAPVPQVCSIRNRLKADQRWPLAHPLFVALDLAKDPGRGQEILNGWDPEKWGTRVW